MVSTDQEVSALVSAPTVAFTDCAMNYYCISSAAVDQDLA